MKHLNRKRLGGPLVIGRLSLVQSCVPHPDRMMDFLRRLLGLSPSKGAKDLLTVAGKRDDGGRRRHQRRYQPRDVDLEKVPYVPLPPAPPTWEVNPRPEEPVYTENLRSIALAGAQQKHTKVIKLSERVPPDDLRGPIGRVVANAYRDTVQKRIRAGQFKPALRWAREMLDRIPDHCDDLDRRRFNRILKELEKQGVTVGETPLEVAPIERVPLFQKGKGTPWKLGRATPLPMEDRPDPALKVIAFTIDGVIYADFSGKSSLARDGGGVVLKRDHEGDVVAIQHIQHDAYRIGVGPGRTGLAVMDSSGILHLYGPDLGPTGKVVLEEDPRVRDHFEYTDTNYWGQFRTQVRAVDVSHDGDWFLFTLADEAWCCSLQGDTQWGLRLPLNEGWERVVGRADRQVLSGQVELALQRMGLELPVDPADVKRAYRKLAFQYHPDRNPGDSMAGRRMQELNEAFEVLTGVDPTTLDFQVEESAVTSFRRTRPDYVVSAGGLRIEVTGLGGPPQDWVYGAAFGKSGRGGFLAAYSGKVVEVDEDGYPCRVYDLGSVPNEIVDMGEFLYFLTPTRLYVLRDRSRLIAFLDVFQQGRLLVTSVGFGLLADKSFKWFTADGRMVGEIMTRDPIRAIYDTPDGCVVETRQHRMALMGLRITSDGSAKGHAL